ncbi:MAG: hypothetical protein EAZ60_10870 [Oscillatoriales cyanobacterium]|nr:MAG: hypothetical protein EAZ60_10870 [Oscillatoriales cyanobacterium]
MIIKPQQYSIFCLRKKEEARKNQQQRSLQNRQGTYVERLSGLLNTFGIGNQDVGIMDKALMQRGFQGFSRHWESGF